MSKNDLRERTLRFRRTIHPTKISEMSEAIGRNVISLPEFQNARIVAAYAALPDEAQTTSVLEESLACGKQLILPVVDVVTDDLLFFEVARISDLSPGRFGIVEPPRSGVPVPLSRTDVVLVPLVAWDERGNRIGYGRGYFDRALPSRGGSVAIGLGFEAQLVMDIPTHESDVPLDIVVTEKRVVRFERREA